MGDVMNATDVVDLFTEMSYCQSVTGDCVIRLQIYCH